MFRAAAKTKSAARRVVPAWLWTRLRIARVRASIALYRRHVVRHTYGGFALDICLADPLGAGWYDHDWVGVPELDVLRQSRVGEGATVFDIGAHQGVVALMLSRIVGERGRVIALEPNAHNAAIARRNRELNRASNLELIQAAGARRCGTLTFNRGLNGGVDDGTGGWGRRRVPCLSIDDLAASHGTPDVIFIDVEGYEEQVLRGASATLASHPDCFVEVHAGCGLEKHGGSVSSILSFFPPQSWLLMIAGPEQEFRPPVTNGLPLERFFLIALGRSCFTTAKYEYYE